MPRSIFIFFSQQNLGSISPIPPTTTPPSTRAKRNIKLRLSSPLPSRLVSFCPMPFRPVAVPLAGCAGLRRAARSGERAALLWQPGQLRGVHGSPAAARPSHGTGPAVWRPTDPRLLQRQEKGTYVDKKRYFVHCLKAVWSSLDSRRTGALLKIDAIKEREQK